jgi:hypothetical protein
MLQFFRIPANFKYGNQFSVRPSLSSVVLLLSLLGGEAQYDEMGVWSISGIMQENGLQLFTHSPFVFTKFSYNVWAACPEDTTYTETAEPC